MLFKAVLLNVRFRTFHTLATCRVSYKPIRNRNNCRLLYAIISSGSVVAACRFGETILFKIPIEVYPGLPSLKAGLTKAKN